jgi:hypothetical protein
VEENTWDWLERNAVYIFVPLTTVSMFLTAELLSSLQPHELMLDVAGDVTGGLGKP